MLNKRVLQLPSVDSLLRCVYTYLERLSVYVLY